MCSTVFFFFFLHTFSVLLLLFNVLILFYFVCLLVCIASKFVVHTEGGQFVNLQDQEFKVSNQYHLVKGGK